LFELAGKRDPEDGVVEAEDLPAPVRACIKAIKAGDAQVAELRHLLAPQARRAAPPAGRHTRRRRVELLALGADEVAQFLLALMWRSASHGGFCTSITGHLKPVSG
jgi:hypothetical protein